MSDGMVTVQPEELKKLIINKLTAVKLPEKDAGIVADVLVFAELRGVHSHGAVRVEHYTQRISAGGMNLSPKLNVNMLKPSVALVDAQGGMGHVVSRYATEEAIKIARKEGICMMAVKNNSHCGALAYYIQMAMDQKMSAMFMVNTDACVVPFGGSTPFFGTNPFAFGYPGSRDNILLDMATSEVAFGKIVYAKEKKHPIPKSWAVDAEGNSVTDPEKAKSLFPFGGAKGYGVMVMIEALTGIMVGGVFGPHLKRMYGDYESYRDLSSVMIVIDPSVFGDAQASLDHAQAMIDELRAVAPAPGVEGVMIPGEIEQKTMERSMKNGIPLAESIYKYLAG